MSRRGFLVAAGGAITGCCAGRGNAKGKSGPLVSFGLVTDLHSADLDPNANRHYRESVRKLGQCVADLNGRDVDFLIELGDFKDQGQTAEATLANLRAVEAVFRRFKGARYHVLGNHDMDRIPKRQALAAMENTGIPRDRSYYAFDVKGAHFVVLDATFRPDGVSYDSGNFKWTEAFVPAEELSWLERDLKATRLPTVVFCHQLLDADSDVYFVRNAAAVRRVLGQSGRVLAVFQGHYHEGRYACVEGIHYYTLNAMVMGSGPQSNAYAVAELFADGTLKVTGVPRAVSRDLRRRTREAVSASAGCSR